jgi:DNA-binding winged helix-turn-helix (wHTH) protein
VIVRFDGCVIDTDTRQVLRAGREIPLSPKAYQLLILLVDARPKALAKDVLYQALWPDTFVVEANLSNLIGEIRAALGDAAQQPRFIRTLHGFGYAFSADAEIAYPPGEGSGASAAYLVTADGTAMPLRGREAIIGRTAEADVRLDLPGISRRHARVLCSVNGIVLEDLQSKNGTFVCGERITAPRVLANGDEVGFGSVRVTFRVTSTEGSTETVRRDDR